MYKVIKYILIPFIYLTIDSPVLFSQAIQNDTPFECIKSGYYLRGSKNGNEDEQPPRKIYIDAFYLSSYEVSNRQYCDFLNQSGIFKDSVHFLLNFVEDSIPALNRIYYIKGIFTVAKQFENHPVNYVSWYGADAYCAYYGYRLPTEAEWEFAAKERRKPIFNPKKQDSGNNWLDKVAWYRNNSDEQTHQVGLLSPNKLNLFDLTGNVDEWCNDWYLSDYYSKSEKENPQGPEKAQFKVIRGGSWYNTEELLSVTNRRATNPKNKKPTIGFRVVKDIE